MEEKDNVLENTQLTPEGVTAPPQEPSMIEEAKKMLEENKRLLESISIERKKIEKASAELLISGRSYAGQATKQETIDEKWAREAKIRYAGTGLDPTL